MRREEEKQWDKWNWWVYWTKRGMTVNVLSIKIQLCERNWIDRMLMDVYERCFLFIWFLKNRMWMCEIWVLWTHHITQSYQLFINSESDCWRVFITTHWFTMTKHMNYDFEYSFPNHLHLNNNTLIHSHLILSESSLSQRK